MVRRQKKKKQEEEKYEHIDMTYMKSVVDDCYTHILGLKFKKIYEPHIEKIGLIAKIFRKQRAKPPRQERMRHLKCMKLTMKIFETFDNHLPQRQAFNQLASLKSKGLDMR